MQAILSHVALLVSSVEESASFLHSQGIKCGEPETFESEGTKEIYVGDYQDQTGLLLLQESIGDGPYKKAMSKRGPSLHHIAFDVLDLKEFLVEAKEVGWQLHPISNSKSAWLFIKGLPLIEVNQKKELSDKYLKVSHLRFSPQIQGQGALTWILGDKVSYGGELCFTIDGKKLSFREIACIK